MRRKQAVNILFFLCLIFPPHDPDHLFFLIIDGRWYLLVNVLGSKLIDETLLHPPAMISRCGGVPD